MFGKIFKLLKKCFTCECDDSRCVEKVEPKEVKMIDLIEASKITGYSSSYLRRLCRKGKICCSMKVKSNSPNDKWMVAESWCYSNRRYAK